MKFIGDKQMSEDRHPNIHAIGLYIDIITALEKRIRGKAKVLNLDQSDRITMMISRFIIDLSDELDNMAG